MPPLTDVTYTPRETFVKPSDIENYDVIQKAMGSLNARSFAKCERILDKGIQEAVNLATDKDRLIFTKLGMIVGDTCLTPHAHREYLWSCALKVFPGDDELANELRLKFLGGLMRWRVSLRGEQWLVYRRKTGNFNHHTGKEIRVSEYWVRKEAHYSVQDLASKYTRSLT